MSANTSCISTCGTGTSNARTGTGTRTCAKRLANRFIHIFMSVSAHRVLVSVGVFVSFAMHVIDSISFLFFSLLLSVSLCWSRLVSVLSAYGC